VGSWCRVGPGCRDLEQTEEGRFCLRRGRVDADHDDRGAAASKTVQRLCVCVVCVWYNVSRSRPCLVVRGWAEAGARRVEQEGGE